MNKNDCFAMERNGCSALKSTHCDNCSFYQTKEQFKQGIEKVNERLCSLDSTTQAYIAEKYNITIGE